VSNWTTPTSAAKRTGGKRGRGAPGKTPFVAAVETTPDGKPVQLKLRRVPASAITRLSVSDTGTVTDAV